MEKLGKILSKIKKQKKNENNGDKKCSICLQKFENNKLELDCGHNFHILCISDWNKRSNTCPICRKQIFIKNHRIAKKKNKKRNVIPIFIIISIIILILSFIPWSRTSLGLKKISIKMLNLIMEIFKNITKIINLILEIILMFLKGIIYAILKICKNFIYILFMIIKIIYNIFSLILIILLCIIMLIMNIIIDFMNVIIFIVESLFKFI